jgi:hypothetical protein
MSLQKIKAEELVKVNQKASKKITILCFWTKQSKMTDLKKKT